MITFHPLPGLSPEATIGLFGGALALFVIAMASIFKRLKAKKKASQEPTSNA